MRSSRSAQERCEVNLLGNWDDFLPHPAREFDNAALQWWLGQLAPGQGDWLRGLPFCHDFSLSGRQVCATWKSESTAHGDCCAIVPVPVAAGNAGAPAEVGLKV